MALGKKKVSQVLFSGLSHNAFFLPRFIITTLPMCFSKSILRQELNLDIHISTFLICGRLLISPVCFC
ncbi:hypothetical protein RchiOBHm_Chr1g0356821 [Rosa chinensis]|uniref:Uncharacterized protein n=1 Tax=Rosa chinensis TaxID=74649 RepID=A0A2P6SHQ2_ROSCH|nr:hypothetical protein RchiOBHm_Chr1g0356821 [Rosa chinensis]